MLSPVGEFALQPKKCFFDWAENFSNWDQDIIERKFKHMKILVATEKPFAAEAIDGIREVVEGANHDFALLEKYTDKQQLLDAVKDADALIIRSDKVTEEVMAAAEKLKIVVRAGAGYDNVDLTAATAKDIVVENTPGQNSNAVAELALGMMVMAARNFYNGKPGTELKGKTLGIQAFGNVGRLVADLARSYGMKVIAYDPFVSEESMKEAEVTPVGDLVNLYRESDYISLHIPATEETKGTINSGLLNLLKPNATIINTARKEVIAEDCMLKAVSMRGIKYCSDVAPNNAAEYAEKAEGKYFFTPKKLGAQTAEANINAGLAAAKQIVAFFKDGDTTFKVN